MAQAQARLTNNARIMIIMACAMASVQEWGIAFHTMIRIVKALMQHRFVARVRECLIVSDTKTVKGNVVGREARTQIQLWLTAYGNRCRMEEVSTAGRTVQVPAPPTASDSQARIVMAICGDRAVMVQTQPTLLDTNSRAFKAAAAVERKCWLVLQCGNIKQYPFSLETTS